MKAAKKETSGHFSFGALARVLAVFCLLLAVLAFVTPMLRKSKSLELAGGETLSALSPLSTALSYYAGGPIDILARAPKIDKEYTKIAGLLAQVRATEGYDRLYLLEQADRRSYTYLVDAGYRDNAAPEVDFFAPATPYPLDVYRPAKGILDRIYTGKSTGEYTGDLVTRKDLKAVVVAYQPIYGSNRKVLAVLAAEVDPGNIEYHIVGGVNLYYFGGSCLLIVLVLWLLSQGKKGLQHFAAAHTEKKAARAAERETAKENTPATADQPLIPAEAAEAASPDEPDNTPPTEGVSH